MDNLDLLLRELNKAVESKEPIYFSVMKTGCLNLYSKVYPTKINYDGWLCISCKDDEFLNFNADDYSLHFDNTEGIPHFTFRKRDEYIGICF